MARGFMKIEYDPTSMQGLSYLINQVDNYPNRLKSAQVAGTTAAQRRIINNLKSGKYGTVWKEMLVEMSINGTRSKIIIKPPPPITRRTKYGYSATWGANVAFYGRRAYRSISPNNTASGPGYSGGWYTLRPESAAKYVPHLKRFRVPRMAPDESTKLDVKLDSAEIFRDEIIKAIRRFGFGPRGGAPRGRGEMPSVRSQARGAK
jgi:hypothetical protein